MTQLEFVDIARDRARPPGGGAVQDGFFVFTNLAQRVDQVAYTLGCTVEHVYHLIAEGAFPFASDISTVGATRACYRIPRSDLVDYINRTRARAVAR